MSAAELSDRFIAIIPARRSSTRLPDKPLADLAGKPMVVRVADCAAASGAERVIIATDDPDIAMVCNRQGYESMLTRNDHRSGTDRLGEVVTRLGLADDAVVVNVQGDEPLMPPTLIADCAHTLLDARDCAIATASHAIEDAAVFFDPNVVKVVTDRLGHALYFSRAPIPWARDAYRDGDRTNVSGVQRHIGIYAYRASFLREFPALQPAPCETLEALEQLRALWHGYRIMVVETREAPPTGVDTAADLERVRHIFSLRASS